jgi:hypothetical protein
MFKKLATVGIIATALVGLVGISPAQAALNGNGSCSLGSGGTAYVFVREFPAEGDLSYVDLDSSSQVDVTYSYDQPWIIGGTEVLATGHFFASPVDGDGFWNYKDNWNWDAVSTDSQVTKVKVHVNQVGSSNTCNVTVYI